MPKISVILPAFNAQDYLREAIDSILNQTYSDFELLIYNDGSTDTTKDIIDSFQDPRIIAFHSPENKGYVHWLNEGIKQAKGEYIARMDADDISLPERFQLQLDFMESHPEIGVCGGQLEIIGTKEFVKKPIKDAEIRWWFFKGNPIGHPTVMIRSAILKNNDLFYQDNLRPAEDFDMWWRMAKHTQLANIKDTVLHYRVHSLQESTAKREIQQKNHDSSADNFLNYLGINTYDFSQKWLKSLFADELSYDASNLLKINKFFTFLSLNKTSASYFSTGNISQKKAEIMTIHLTNLSTFNPKLLVLLFQKDMYYLLKQANVKLIPFIIKSLSFWKTRERN